MRVEGLWFPKFFFSFTPKTTPQAWTVKGKSSFFCSFFGAANLPSDTRPKGLRNKELIEPDQVVSAEQAEEFSTTNHTTSDAEGRAGEPETAEPLER